MRVREVTCSENTETAASSCVVTRNSSLTSVRGLSSSLQSDSLTSASSMGPKQAWSSAEEATQEENEDSSDDEIVWNIRTEEPDEEGTQLETASETMDVTTPTMQDADIEATIDAKSPRKKAMPVFHLKFFVYLNVCDLDDVWCLHVR